MKKQRNIDRVKELQWENYTLRQKMAAGERRRRAGYVNGRNLTCEEQEQIEVFEICLYALGEAE